MDASGQKSLRNRASSDSSGLDALRLVSVEMPAVPVVVLTGHEDLVRAALANGRFIEVFDDWKEAHRILLEQQEKAKSEAERGKGD